MSARDRGCFGIDLDSVTDQQLGGYLGRLILEQDRVEREIRRRQAPLRAKPGGTHTSTQPRVEPRTKIPSTIRPKPESEWSRLPLLTKWAILMGTTLAVALGTAMIAIAFTKL